MHGFFKMKAADKDNYIKELRKIISEINVEALNKDPKNELVNQNFYRAKAIFKDFDSSMGKRMGDLMFSIQNPLRSKREVDGASLRNWVIERTEEMDVYKIEDTDNVVGEKIKRILENENLKVQSNIQGEDEHLLIFDKSVKDGGHVHLIRDGGTGEMRIDPKDASPHELLLKVETVLTTKAGQKIRSTLNKLEFLEDQVNEAETPILDLVSPMGRSGGPNGHFQTFRVKNLSPIKTAIDCLFIIRGFSYAWRNQSKDPITLSPQETIDISYKISDEKTFHEPVKELNFVMEFSDTYGNKYHTRRELDQVLVSSGSFYEINIGKFHHVAKSVDDNLQPLTGISRNGDAYEMLFGITANDVVTKISIGISGTFLACWGFTGESELKQALIELAHRKIRKMVKDNNIKQSYIFITADFPQEFQLGWEGYVKTRDSLV